MDTLSIYSVHELKRMLRFYLIEPKNRQCRENVRRIKLTLLCRWKWNRKEFLAPPDRIVVYCA